MVDWARLLGAAVGNLIGNPATIIAGVVLSRHQALSGRAVFEALVALLACLGVQLAVERMEPDLPAVYSLSFWFGVEAVSIAIATLVFWTGRKLRSRRNALQKAGYSREDDDVAED